MIVFIIGVGVGAAAVVAVALLLFVADSRDTLCMTCKRYFNSSTRSLGCPHRRKGRGLT